MRSPLQAAALTVLLAINGCAPSSRQTENTDKPGLNVAEAALQGGAGQVALRLTDEILRASPNDSNALEIKADALTLLGVPDEAVTIYQRLLAQDPMSIRSNTGLGRIQLTKDPAAAEVLFERVLKRDPGNLTALNNLGIARDLLGRHTEAQTAYRQALAIDPALNSAKVNLALSLAMAGHVPPATGASPPTNGQPAPVRQARNEVIPPDVTQPVPGPAATQPATLPAAPRAVAMAPLAPPSAPPAVVRPRPAEGLEAGLPVVQPVNPIAAAVVNQRALSLPGSIAEPPPARIAAPPTIPDVVRMPQPSSAAPMPDIAPITPQSVPVARMAAVAPAQVLPAEESRGPATATSEAPGPRAQTVPEVPPAEPAARGPDQKSAPARPHIERRRPNGASVQFTVAHSEEAAQAFWRDLVQRFPDTLGQRAPLLTLFRRHGVEFWRLRADGFESPTDAGSVCEQLRAAGQDCFMIRS